MGDVTEPFGVIDAADNAAFQAAFISGQSGTPVIRDYGAPDGL